ncbi:MAG: peptidoglycan-binding protein [Oscillospiraceae bacterium]|nr:peptidoglycan-binding protein [Oscillospiraceae bacterium]
MKVMKKLVSLLLVLILCLGTVTPLASAAVVTKGSSGSVVRQVQYNLNFLGFNVGSADGICGNNTVKGIRSYQSARGLSVDGMAGPETQGNLKSEVKAIQTLLKNKGFYYDSLDGIAGPNTVAAAKSFQKAAGLKQNGVVNKDVLSKLKNWNNTPSQGGYGNMMKPYTDGGYSNYYVVKGYNKNYRFNQNNYSRFIVSGRNQGCTATSACMVISMAKGKTVFPKNYPWYSDGCHWENTKYITSEGRSTKLLQIANQLKKGRAIALWANEYHMVCVIGLRSGANMNNLKASDFLIIDPYGGYVTTLNNANHGGYYYTTYRMYYAA